MCVRLLEDASIVKLLHCIEVVHTMLLIVCVYFFSVPVQINKAYHAVKGGAFSEEHLDQGTTFLVQLIKTMQRTHPQWTKEQQLKGKTVSLCSSHGASLLPFITRPPPTTTSSSIHMALLDI